jgi:hypothetical protein
MKPAGRALLVTFGLTIAVHVNGSASPVPRLRGVDAAARALIASALARSPTACELAARLEASDVIVYVRLSTAATRTASTAILDGSGPVRYLLVSVNPARSADAVLELFAHELQHVVEIAGARDVRTDAALVGLYRRIGLSRIATNRFETAAAQHVSRRVRRELAIDPGVASARK